LDDRHISARPTSTSGSSGVHAFEMHGSMTSTTSAELTKLARIVGDQLQRKLNKAFGSGKRRPPVTASSKALGESLAGDPAVQPEFTVDSGFSNSTPLVEVFCRPPGEKYAIGVQLQDGQFRLCVLTKELSRESAGRALPRATSASRHGGELVRFRVP